MHESVIRQETELVFFLSETGIRDVNEDAFKICEEGIRKVYLVADGCGGHANGNVASGIAVEYIASKLETHSSEVTEDVIMHILESCNDEILLKQQQYGGMRTTIAGFVYASGSSFAFNIGDTRVYQIRDGSVVFRTEDHSVPFVLYKAGIIEEEEISMHEDRNKLLQAMGESGDLKPNIYKLDWMPEDLFLIATDGLWAKLHPVDFMECVPQKAGQWMGMIRERMIEYADTEQDNYTGLLIGDISE